MVFLFFLKSSTAVHFSFFFSVTVQKKSYLDPLQSGGGLGHILRHVEAFGRADLGVDQPLLEVSEGGAEPLLQQPLLVLALPGRPEAEAGGAQEEVEKTDGDGWRRAEGRREGKKGITRALCRTHRQCAPHTSTDKVKLKHSHVSVIHGY